MVKTYKPIVRNDLLDLTSKESSGDHQIQVESKAWFVWLAAGDHPGFIYEGDAGHFTARREIRRGKNYWYAYRRREGKLSKTYLGKTEDLTVERLIEASERLAGQITMDQLLNRNNSVDSNAPTSSKNNQTIPYAGSTGGFPSIPLTKVKIPVLPQNLIARPRLTNRINTPVTLICAPAGYGKSTLLNEWRLSSGMQVAWVNLDEEDNHPLRFWSAVVTALQTVRTNIGQRLLVQLRTSSQTDLSKIIIELTNDIVRLTEAATGSQGIGVILDNFHYIQNPEIYSSLTFLMDHLPPNMKLVFASQTILPLPLGHLRSKGMVLELGADDLRFTLEEGIEYLWRHTLEEHLAYRDMQRLVKRTEGWITGLVLAVSALPQQENSSKFVASFTGAHPFLQEFFAANILEKQPPEVQSFLLQSSILNHLSGPLCDAITGQTGGIETLEKLWEEDLFLKRIEPDHLHELDWYRFHDIFREVLQTLMHKQFPADLPNLYQRAANWYITHNTPTEAIQYLLVSEKWEEAASLIEEVGLQELEQLSGGPRLLRWLQQLPETVLQQHHQLLGMYVRLESLAVPASEVEDFLERAEWKIVSIQPEERTKAVQESLSEINKIRQIRGLPFQSIIRSQRRGGYVSACQILDGIQKYQRLLRQDVVQAESMAAEVYETAHARNHLFGILVAGGACANLALSQGQLRRSERIANQVLEQAYTVSGNLPESASNALTALSRVFYERNQLIQAHQFLVRAAEVDPNPVSMNEPVMIALLRAKIQSAQGNYDAAISTIQVVRDLLVQRPSNIWFQQDLISYQALFLLRQGNLAAAERKLGEGGELGKCPFSALTQAAILIEQKRYVAAEDIINHLLDLHPKGYYWLPTIRARVMLATALFNQHKINQACQAMVEAARLSGPEFFVRPFFVSGTEIVSLLSLVLHTENLNSGIRAFLKGTLTMLGHADGVKEILPHEEAEALSVAASITPREQQVLRLLNANLSNREIAAQCSISTSTVKTHLENIYRKLGVNSRTEASAHARMLNLA